MALALKFEEGGKYTYYGAEYDLNELRLLVYNTLDSFISSIKYGKKNHDEIYKAVDNLMNGLATGRVTVGDNRLHDSKGEYRNTDKYKHDAYGMATAHILLCMSYMTPTEKEKEEEKKPYTASVAGEWLNNRLFGTSKPNSSLILQFVNLDLPVDGKRSNTIRTEKMLPYIQDYYDKFDEYTKDYDMSDEDKDRYKSYLQLAIEDAKSDNSFTENEYLNLSHAFGNNNWDLYFATEASKPKRMVGSIEVPDDYVEIKTKNGSFYVNPNYLSDNNNMPDIFNVFMQGQYGNDDVKDIDINLLSPDIDADTEDELEELLGNRSDLLIKELKIVFNGEQGDTPFLKAMAEGLLESVYNNDTNKAEDAHKLAITYALRYLSVYDNNTESSGEIALFPYLTRSNLILAFDPNNNRLYWTSQRKSSQFMSKALLEFNEALRGSNLNIISNFKIGGVLKFDIGNKILKGLDGITDWDELIKAYNTPENYELLNYETKWDYSNGLYNPNYTTWYEGDNPSTTPIGSKNTSKNKGMYSIPGISVNSSDAEKNAYRKAIEKMENDPYYQRVTNEAFNEKGELTDLGEQYMHHYDKLATQANNGVLPDYSFFDKNGNLRTSWTTSEDIYGNPGVTYNNVKDYWEAIRGHLLAGQGHNIFPLVGKRYFYTNNEGKRVYVSEKDALNFNPQQIEEVVHEGPITWTDYEIKVPEAPEEEISEEGAKKEPEDERSDIFGKTDLITPGKVNTWFDDLFPGAIAAGRLLGTLHNNNRAYKALNRTLKPVLKNTYELYSPVTGEFGLMLAYNLQAADANRLADRNATSDAALNAAERLDANRQANQLQEKGQLLDNDEIKRTSQEALKRQEGDVARRTDTANYNRASINETNRLKGELEAEHITQNWGAIDNYLSGIEKRKRTENQENKDFLRDFIAKTTATNVLNQIDQSLSPFQKAMYDWMNDPKNANKDITEWPGYYPLLSLLRELSNYGTNTVYGAVAGQYGIPYDYNGNIEDIIRKYAGRIKAKKGAKLIRRKK